MSPLRLRRYRAERLLSREFEALRGRVTARAHARLAAAGVRLADEDLQDCYAQAWQGLYALVLAGEQVQSPDSWLVLATYRRALDEHRSRSRRRRRDLRAAGLASPGEDWSESAAARASSLPADHVACEDPAIALYERIRVRQLLEGMCSRLSARELQAATLCYLQGLSRSEAAAQMGVSQRRMRRLMEGHGPGSPGVAGKVGALVDAIRDERFCEERGSLMRGLAFGVLDPAGERHRLALAHSDQCPACRAYVRSLRGLASVLPPAPALVRLALAGSAARSHAGALHAPGAHVATAGRSQAGGATIPAGAAAGTGAAGAGAGAAGAGGSWLFAGGAAKLAVGCLLAAGLSAGCVALSIGPASVSHRSGHRRPAARALAAGAHARATAAGARAGIPSPSVSPAPRRLASPAVLRPSARASREFGPEQAPGARPASVAGSPSQPAVAARVVASSGTHEQDAVSQAPPGASQRESPAPGPSAAQREFGIG